MGYTNGIKSTLYLIYSISHHNGEEGDWQQPSQEVSQLRTTRREGLGIGASLEGGSYDARSRGYKGRLRLKCGKRNKGEEEM